MPLYEYQCDACGARFELIRKFSDPPLEVCPTCGRGPVTKLVSSPAFQFKGSGWYITDYARKSGGDSASSESKGEKSGPASASSGDSASSSSSDSSSKPKESGGTEKAAKPATTAGSQKDT